MPRTPYIWISPVFTLNLSLSHLGCLKHPYSWSPCFTISTLSLNPLFIPHSNDISRSELGVYNFFNFFLSAFVVKTPTTNAGDAGLILGLGRSPGKGNEMATHFNILAWEMYGPRSLMGYSPWGRKRCGHDLVSKQQQQSPLLTPSSSSLQPSG